MSEFGTSFAYMKDDAFVQSPCDGERSIELWCAFGSGAPAAESVVSVSAMTATIGPADQTVRQTCVTSAFGASV